MVSLWVDAHSSRLANALKEEMKERFADLYEFSVGVATYDTMNPDSTPKRTDSIAISIINKQQAYLKRIQAYRERYRRFNNIVDTLQGDEKEIVTAFFVKQKSVDYVELRNIMRKHLKQLENIYLEADQVKEAETAVISRALGIAAPIIQEPKVSAEKQAKNLSRARKTLSQLFG